ncbi:uncharacterized protein [Dermacentor albipictus]|uniref:uncharacterized protein isoform X2 n=1 Tax=Dermacentor albipictus TaxID=60249 RepID=UPI0038FD1589
MMGKLRSRDKTIKKLAVVSTLYAVKRKAVEFGMCRNEDLKVYLLDGTEVDEEAFSCLAESVESGTHTFTLCIGEWISGVQMDGRLSNIPRDVVLLLTSFLRSNTGNDAVLEWSLKITQAETSLGDKDAASVGLKPLVVSYFKDDLSQLVQVHEVLTEMTGNFLDALPVCPVIVALGQSIFQCTCHLFVDRELVIPNIGLMLAIERLFAVHYYLNVKYEARVGAALEFLQRYLVGNQHRRAHGSKLKGAKVPVRKIWQCAQRLHHSRRNGALKWCKGTGHQILFNLCLALVGALASFVAMAALPKHRASLVSCTCVGAALHYFLLVSFAWTFVESLLQYLRFVRVLGAYVPNLVLKAAFGAWGCEFNCPPRTWNEHFVALGHHSMHLNREELQCWSYCASS